jgi:ABC-type oligopeptide transport system ATPase subunit
MLYSSLTAIENLDYFSGISKKEFSKSELETFLIDAGLQKEVFNKRISTFSKGMRQKVGIAIALAKDAKALLLDEPTSGNSTEDYENYRIQVINFAETWREYLNTFLFNNLDFSTNDYINLPKFEMIRDKFSVTSAILTLLLISIIILLPGLVFLNKDFYFDE